MGAFIDLTGKTFGRLTVIRDSGQRKRGQVLWECECSCKNHTHVLVCSGNLKSLHTRSCGCLQEEARVASGKAKRKENKFVEHEDYLEGFDASGNSFKIDKEDYSKVKERYWSYSKATRYWQTSWIENKCNNHLRLHQVICPGADGHTFVVDHINRDTSDNRKSNLRIISKRNNCINSGLQSNNKSGIIGVNWSNPEQKWRASITIEKGKQRILGRFDDKEDAIKCRLKAEIKYYGKDIAPQRDLFEKYGV